MNKEIDETKYATDLITEYGFWVVLLALSILGWFCYICYCCYSGECCCKPKLCCKREKPYNKIEKWCPLFTFWVANLGVFIIALTGFGVSAGFKNGYYSTQCSIFTFTDQIIWGDGGKWQGVVGVKNKIV